MWVPILRRKCLAFAHSLYIHMIGPLLGESRQVAAQLCCGAAWLWRSFVVAQLCCGAAWLWRSFVVARLCWRIHSKLAIGI